jgi:hypothetical protein
MESQDQPQSQDQQQEISQQFERVDSGSDSTCGSSLEWDVIRSDRQALIQRAIMFVDAMNFHMRGDDYKESPVTKEAEEAYSAAMRLLTREFDAGPSKVQSHLQKSTEDY